MRISVIGCGYLGAVHAACMSSLGHDVIGIDVDETKIAALAKGEAPFFEPNLPELLIAESASGRLTFSTDISAAAGAALHFIAVGTPQQADSNNADLSYVYGAIDALIPHLAPGDVVVGKSTVPVGTAQAIADRIAAQVDGVTLAWNPEFLREGFAVSDTLTPDRIVYGLPRGEAGTRAGDLLDQLYKTAIDRPTPRLITDYATAELVKVSANAFLATKISFINAMAEICEIAGADVTQLADAIGLDDRIGRKFLNSGLGFGGGCLPKDIRAFMARADELGTGESLGFLREIDEINLRRRTRAITLATEMLAGSVDGKRIAVHGLAFKPNSDDIRDSPALDVALRLMALGADVVAHDPQANGPASARHPELNTVATPEEAITDAELVLVLTEWNEFKSLDAEALIGLPAQAAILDARNCLDRAAWRTAGWQFRSLGRP